MAFDVNKFLGEADKNFDETKKRVASGGRIDLPDGSYIMKLTSGEFKETKKGRAICLLQWSVLEPAEYSGARYSDFIILDGELGIDPLCWRLNQLEVDLEQTQPSEFPAVLDELVKEGTICKITLSSTEVGDRTFQNISGAEVLPEFEEDVRPAPQDAEDETEAFSEAQQAGKAAPISQETTDTDEGEELAVGHKVAFTQPETNKTLQGIVKSISEDETTCNIKVGQKLISDIPLENVVEIIKEEAVV